MISAMITADCGQCARSQRKPSAPPSVARLVQNEKYDIKLSPYALSPLTVCEAIRKTTQVAHTTKDDIAPHNKEQRNFLDKQYLLYVKNNLLNLFSPDELQSYASRNADELNAILQRKGFSLQFPPLKRNQIGVLAIQDVLVKWLLQGTKEPLSVGESMYDGVILKDEIVPEGSKKGERTLQFFAQNPSSTVIVKLLTKSNDVVYFVTKRDGQLFKQKPTEEAISQAIMHYSSEVKKGTSALVNDRFTGVHFPMISYNVNPDISWLVHMRIGTTSIAQAMQQVIFKMNEEGARAKAAAALIVATSFLGENPKERLVIDKPFLVWIERPGVVLPIFAGYMTQEFWKNPGVL